MITAGKIRLINELRRNSRRSLTRISCDAGIPLSSSFKTLIKTEGKVIRKYVALVHFALLGYPFKIGLLVKTLKQVDTRKFFSEHANLNTLLRLSGDYDLCSELLFSDMVEYQNFIDELNESGLVNKSSLHFITDVKQEEFRIGGGK